MFPIVAKQYRRSVLGLFNTGIFNTGILVLWSNTSVIFWYGEAHYIKPSQIRTRPIPMTEEEVRAIRKETGKSPYFEKKFVPVAKGRPRSQTKRKK